MIHNTNLESFAILLEFFKGRPLKRTKIYTSFLIFIIIKNF